MTILNLNQLLIKTQQHINKVIKPIPKRQLLTRASNQLVTLEVNNDEYFYALLLNNLPPTYRHRK
jgi:hypothetical protein